MNMICRLIEIILHLWIVCTDDLLLLYMITHVLKCHNLLFPVVASWFKPQTQQFGLGSSTKG